MSDLLDPLSAGTRADELTSDTAFLDALVATELALTRALVARGRAPEWMLEVCAAIESPRLESVAQAARGGGNPVIPLVKSLGAAADAIHPGASDHLHVGATSQDIMDTATVLIARGVLDEVAAQLEAAGERLAALADEHRATPMVGRTLGQQATPTTFGFVAAVWLDAVTDALGALDLALPVQLGGAVGTLSVLDELGAADVVPAFAVELGLARPPIAWHSNRSVIVELGHALGLATGAAGLVSLDVTVLARTEIAELSERLGQGQGGSSAMPHKRNPVTAVLVTAAARQAPALVGALAGSMLSEDQRPSGSWHAEWLPLRALERLAITATTGLASLVNRLDIDAERMLANLEFTNGLVFSERAATALGASLGKKAAFDLVESASAESFETGRPLQVVLLARLAADGHDDRLRSRATAAFELGATPAVEAAIDTVIDNFRKVRA
ncbi:3-carboxy-cis,cis-muconate cycloisomerase [soil metagenome]